MSPGEKTPSWTNGAALQGRLHALTVRAEAGSPGWPVLAAWLLIGLVTTLPGLWTRSLHYDEVRETRLAQAPIASQLNPQAFDIDSPPLYHMLLHPVLRLLGTSHVSIRLVAWLAGGFLVPIAFLLLRSLFPDRLATLGTLGFTVCAWRVELSQMARPHGLFLLIALLSLIAFPPAAGKGSWRGPIVYCLVLVAAAQLSYWGILVVIPSHLAATVSCRKTYTYWKRAVVAQGIAVSTCIYYAPLLLWSYTRHSRAAESAGRALAAPLFARCLVLFGCGSLGELDLIDLPLAVGMAAVVGWVVIRGALAWMRSAEGFSRWLGVCVGAWTGLLFLAHCLAASLPKWPMERRFALLLVPLLLAFLFGLQSIESPRWRYAVMGSWIVVGGAFSVRSMAADTLRESGRVSAILAAQPRPLLVYSRRVFWIDFLAAEAGAASGMTFREITQDVEGEHDGMAMEVDWQYAGICVCLIREGGYLTGRLRALTNGGESPDVDGKMKSAVTRITERFAADGWRPTLSEFYPGRVSFHTVCFAPPQRRQAMMRQSDGRAQVRK